MNILERIEKKKVLILGFGREGLSTYRFLRKHFPEKKLAIADKKRLDEFEADIIKLVKRDKKLTYHLGEKYLKSIDLYEIVIKTPGIPHKLEEIRKAKNNGVKFTSQTDIFSEICRGRIIGITGTKGKSTTTSLIHHILKAVKINAILLGNIGKPPLDYLYEGDENTFFIFEMSSHQLMVVNRSPYISVFLNIFPEHLDYYSNYEEYVEAKSNITRFQKNSDFFIYNADFPEIEKVAKETKANKFSFSLRSKVENGCHMDKGRIIFVIKGSKEFSFDVNKIHLLGTHNLNNIMAAIIVTRVSGVDFEDIEKALSSFRPLEGRLETVRVYKSVSFVNDTLATIPEATIAALESFKDKNITLILGGFDRGISYDVLGKDLSKRKNVSKILLIGQTAPRIKKSLEKLRYKGEVYDLGLPKMVEIVKLSLKITDPNGIVLLSPASTSFDMFKDYKDRGDQFRDAVLKLDKGPK